MILIDGSFVDDGTNLINATIDQNVSIWASLDLTGRKQRCAWTGCSPYIIMVAGTLKVGKSRTESISVHYSCIRRAAANENADCCTGKIEICLPSARPYPCFNAIKVGDGDHNAITSQVTW